MKSEKLRYSIYFPSQTLSLSMVNKHLKKIIFFCLLFTCCKYACAQSYDFGDAPASYNTNSLGLSVPPRHTTSATLILGASVDIELAPLTVASGANNNGTNGDGIDESSVTSIPAITINAVYSVSVAVNNTSGAARTLHGWIDFNNNGRFSASEYAFVNVPNGTAGTVTLSWTAVQTRDALAANLYMRLRIASPAALADDIATTVVDERSIADGGSLGIYTGAQIGEVEDYRVAVTPAYDYGDTPVSFEANSNGLAVPARHLPVNTLYLGNSFDTESTPPNVSAGADNNSTNGDGADENGLTLVPVISSGVGFSVTANVYKTIAGNATLIGWVDKNNNGQFEAAEAATTTISSTTGATTATLNWSGALIIASKIYMRLRVTTGALSDAGATIFVDERSVGNGTSSGVYTATLLNGEIEDYQVTVYPTVAISGTVTNDANGLSDNTVNGTGTNAGNTLYAVLYDNTIGKVYAISAVASDGTYAFRGISGNNFTVYITTSSPVLGQLAVPSVILPSGWLNTGEYRGAGAGSDGSVNGALNIGTLILNAANANFGITQAGYIYIHKKTLNEESSVDFTFSVSGGVTSISNFVLNDKPDNINSYDLGASHGPSGDGQLWAVTNVVASGLPHQVEGPIYMRPAGSASWVATGQTGKNVDGAGYNQMVYSNNAGQVYFYTYGGSANIIYDPANHGTTGVYDVAYGNGTTVLTDRNGRILKYTGTYAGGSDSWTDLTAISGATTSTTVLDIVPSTQKVVFQATNGNVYTMNIDGTGLTLLNYPADADYADYDEIAVDDSGKIFASFYSYTYGWDFVHAYNSITGTWAIEYQAAMLRGITGGAAGQMWASSNSFSGGSGLGTVISRTTEGGSNWLDDERVRTTVIGNSIMIPVIPGTYSLSESLPSGWDLNKINLYDPTANSSAVVSTQVSTVNITAGEVVHVVYENALVTTSPVGTACNSGFVQNFGSGVPALGSALTGTTSYHYQAIPNPSDGYYVLAKNTASWFNPGTLTDHTGLANGYFVIMNASFQPDEFYRQRVTGLSVGSPYTLTIWAANISPGGLNKPNILMGIADVTTGVTQASLSTGDITATTWTKYTFSFTAASASLDIFIRNNAAGGPGNDLAIDDIAMELTPISNTPISTTVTPATCAGPGAITITAPLGSNIEYSINGTTFQSGVNFNSIASGTYTITARYKNTTCTTTKPDTIIVSSGLDGLWVGGPSGNWNVAANWCNGVPTSATNVIIPAGSTVNIQSANAVANSISIANTASLVMTGAYNLNITAGGSFTNNGSFNATASTGTVNFLGDGTITGTTTFKNIDTYGAVNFGAAGTVSGTFSIQPGGSVAGNAPTYTCPSSVLAYKTGGTFTRGVEWDNNVSSGKGYPSNVYVQNNTTINFPANGHGWICNDLQIDNGSSLMQNYSGGSKTIVVGRNVTINGTLTLGDYADGNMRLGGNWARNTGGVFNPNDAVVTFEGAGMSTISAPVSSAKDNEGGFGGEKFAHLWIDKSNPADSVVLLSNVTVTREIGFENGTFSLRNSDVTLVSNSSRTADVAPINTPANTSILYGGTGRFIVQRFIPNPTGTRSWRLLTAPLQASDAPSLNQAWQQGVVNPDRAAPNANGGAYNPWPGYGTHITGPGGTYSDANGFDHGTNSSSVLYTAAGIPGWATPTSTKATKITDQQGWMLFVRGDRGFAIGNQYVPAQNTVLEPKGKINTGDVSVGVTAGKQMIGNPYASSISLLNVDVAGTAGKLSTYYQWDPKMYTSFTQPGKWVTFTGIGSSFIHTTSESAYPADGTIESGQAFILDVLSAGNVVFHESDKKQLSSSLVGLESGTSSRPVGNSFGIFRTDIYVSNGNRLAITDAVVNVFNAGYENAADEEDAKKLVTLNTKESLSILRDAVKMAIEKRRDIQDADTIFFSISKFNELPYRFHFEARDFAPGLEAYLEDNYTMLRTPVSTNGITDVDFNITADSLSKAGDRFRVVFKTIHTTLPVTFTTVKAYLQNKNVLVEWKVANEINIKQYEVERSLDGIYFERTNSTLATGNSMYKWLDENASPGINYYRIAAIGNDGAKQYSAVVKVNMLKAKGNISVYPNPVTDGIIKLHFEDMPTGSYVIGMYNAAGQMVQAASIDHSGANTIHEIVGGKMFAKGIYSLEINDKRDDKKIVKVIVE